MKQPIKKPDIMKIIDSLYITLLGIGLGGVLALGIFVASTLFNSTHFLGHALLTHYQEGMLMSAIFVKFNVFLYILAGIIFLREGYDYKSFKRDKVLTLATLIALFAIFMFTDYYTPAILELQALHNTESEIFANYHKGSELDFKLLSLALIALITRRVYLK